MVAPSVITLLQLRVHERSEQLAVPILHVPRLVPSSLEKRCESLLCFRPRQRRGKRREAVKEPVGRWQRDVVDEILRCRDRAPIKARNSARERIHEAVQLVVRKRPIDVSVSFSGLAVEVVRTEHDFERATPADERRKAFVAAAAGCTPEPTSTCARAVFSREANRMSQARRNSLDTPRARPRIFAMLTTGDLVRRTNVSSSDGRPEGPTV
jgi:hypothetical protein